MAVELRFLHPDSSLSPAKLTMLRQLSTELLIATLMPPRGDCLKVRLDGLVMDGHHRLHILRERGVNIEELPRETWQKEDL